MASLHLGVATAVINDQNEILLSQRGDMDVWNLPTGRLDKGEYVAEAAAREVREETGVICRVTHPIGLYYQVGRGRMNILFGATYEGGELLQKTNETRANRFFSPDALPEKIFGDFMVRDAFKKGVHLFALETSPQVLRRVRRQLAWRYMRNLLAGKPEPRWAKFDVQASLMVVNTHDQTILSVPYGNGERVLPGLAVNGESAMWEQVNRYVRQHYEIYELKQVPVRWVGLYQHITRNALEFVFASDITPQSSINTHTIQWTTPDNLQWWRGYRPFIEHVALHRPDILMIQE
jgi:ADP-ribose pyrophosphatase YjhB (NUDIX family)